LSKDVYRQKFAYVKLQLLQNIYPDVDAISIGVQPKIKNEGMIDYA